MDRTTALLKASISYERGKGHQFRRQERVYQDFADKIGDMEIELEITDEFSRSIFNKLNALRQELEMEALRLEDEYKCRE